MNRAHRWYLCLLTALVCAFGLSLSAYGQEPTPKIVSITVVGNKVLNSESIIAVSGLKVGDSLTRAALDQARQNLLLTGNYGARRPENPEDAVRITAEVQGEEARVTIEVDENDLVSGITISGTGPLPVSEIRELLRTREGVILNMSVLQGDIDRIQKHYSSKGYQAFVSSDIGISNGILTIPIVVATVNRIRVTGLKKTQERVVLREMRLKANSYFSQRQLEQDITRIYNTNHFENVDISFSFPEPGKVDVILNVQEKRTGTVAVGVGYSNRRKLVGRAEIGDSNFLGRGLEAGLLWETGGLANRNSFELNFTEPWLDRNNTSISVSLYDKTVYRFGRGIESGSGTTVGTSTDYFETHTGGSVTLGRPLSNNWRGFVGVRHDNVKVPALSLNLEDAAVLQNGPLTSFSLRATRNTRDVDIEPAWGGFEIYSVDFGFADLSPVGTAGGETPTGVFGNVNYQKLQVDVRRYFSPQGRRKTPKDRRNIFALRMLLGTSTGTLPFSEQYFVGGAETLRGYVEDRFWGKNMVLGSMEFRTPLANALTGVIFADFGDAWGGPYEGVRFSGLDQHSNFSPSYGVGLGLRVVTPIGPIRIDQGFGREGSRTHFSIGHVF
jgi:outer membrane protein insertion porin family